MGREQALKIDNVQADLEQRRKEAEKKAALRASVREKMRAGIPITDPEEMKEYDEMVTEERNDDQMERRGRY
jgi:hypothetical protein